MAKRVRGGLSRGWACGWWPRNARRGSVHGRACRLVVRGGRGADKRGPQGSGTDARAL
jgi:hypothetical protein